MNANRWAQIKQLYDLAQEQLPSEREPFVEALTQNDRELKDEVLRMLRDSSNAGNLLDMSLMGRQWVRPILSPSIFSPGQVLDGRYRVVRAIGAGGMGEVFEAEDLELGARVAIKTMRVADVEARIRFKLEIQMARSVTHPNVCRIFDLHRYQEPKSDQVITFLTMELVDGETLSEYLARKGPLKPAEALPILRQIAAALSAAHQKNVAHRDLKPGNVILTANGGAIVTDFGLASPLTEVTESTVTIVGTPAYMAPEQFEGKPVSAAADIYAFGVLMYEMVVGKRPFQGDSPIAIALEKLRQEPPEAGDAMPSLPAAWSAVIRRCMNPSPERRFTDALDAIRQLEQSGDRVRMIRLTRKQKRWLAAAALFICTATLLGWRYRQSVYVTSNAALQTYKLGVHAQQLGLPWTASQLFTKALEEDPRFVGARVRLAETWMELDQPSQAKVALVEAQKLRPRWQRLAPTQALLEQAAHAQLEGRLADSIHFHEQASKLAPDAEKAEVRFSEGAAQIRAGNITRALAIFKSLAGAQKDNCDALFRQGILMTWVPDLRKHLRGAEVCFNTVGDLTGEGETLAQISQVGSSGSVTEMRRALALALTTGNIEQQIKAKGILSQELLQTGETEEAYSLFSEAMQLADRSNARFLTVRLLCDRAEYFFRVKDFLQFEYFNGLALTVSRAAETPAFFSRCSMSRARMFLQMRLPSEATGWLETAKRKLQTYPNAALMAEISELIAETKRTNGRPEERTSQFTAK